MQTFSPCKGHLRVAASLLHAGQLSEDSVAVTVPIAHVSREEVAVACRLTAASEPDMHALHSRQWEELQTGHVKDGLERDSYT